MDISPSSLSDITPDDGIQTTAGVDVLKKSEDFQKQTGESLVQLIGRAGPQRGPGAPAGSPGALADVYA